LKNKANRAFRALFGNSIGFSYEPNEAIRSAIPSGAWPLEMHAQTAAAYCDETAVDASCRGMSGKEAAKLYGLSVSALRKARQQGKIPGPTLPGKRYDRVLLERHMNKLSGIVEDISTPLDDWRKHHGARQS
jgi:hypothetical protein